MISFFPYAAKGAFVKSTREILEDLGFESQASCPYCFFSMKENGSCCGETGRAQVMYCEKSDPAWLTEAEAISRIESDGRAEAYFKKLMSAG